VSSSGDVPESSSKREAIIDIAAQSFARQGFHGVSMRDIAKANDSSVATLYNHFASKDALMLAIGQRFYPAFLLDMESGPQRADRNRAPPRQRSCQRSHQQLHQRIHQQQAGSLG
jgi:AcrR family transcriptional regulator